MCDLCRDQGIKGHNNTLPWVRVRNSLIFGLHLDFNLCLCLLCNVYNAGQLSVTPFPSSAPSRSVTRSLQREGAAAPR